MPNRFPLIVDSSAQQLKELPANDNLDLTSSGIVGVTSVGVNTASTSTNLYVQGTAASSIVGLGTTNATTTLNLAQGNNFSMTLTGNITLANPTGLTPGQSGVILIQQDSVGSRTVGFGTFWDFPNLTAPTLTTRANGLDAITYFVRDSTTIVSNSVLGVL